VLYHTRLKRLAGNKRLRLLAPFLVKKKILFQHNLWMGPKS